jgi:hypothetical protein
MQLSKDYYKIYYRGLPDHEQRIKVSNFITNSNKNISKRHWKYQQKKYQFYDYMIIDRTGSILVLCKNKELIFIFEEDRNSILGRELVKLERKIKLQNLN